MTIVAATDRVERESKPVIEGAKLAMAFDEEFHVVHVLSQSEFRELEQTSVEDTGQTIPIEEVRSYAKGIATDIASNTTDSFEPVGLVGHAADEIVHYAEREDASYICVGGRRRSAVGKALFGSVTQDVLLHANRPVVTYIEPEQE